MKQNGRLYKFLNGKGFYVALGICMVAIGVSAWTAVSTLSGTTVSKNETSGYEQSSTAELPAQKTESNIAKNSSTQSKTASQKSVANKPTEKTASEQPTAGYFVYPVTGEIIKDFSAEKLQYSVTFNDLRIHKGIDIAAKEGTAIKSAGAGTVTESGKSSEYGYYVKINHGNNISVVYAGLNGKNMAQKGQTVAAGTLIGALGTVTAESLDAPHLHLEFYEGKTVVSPLEMLSKVQNK